jgi:flagellar basal body L-ring protein FlgH
MSSNPPPPTLLLYKDKGNGWNPFSPRAVNGARPWNQLVQVQSAELETNTDKPWTLKLGDIVTVCVPENTQSISSQGSSDDDDADIKSDPEDANVMMPSTKASHHAATLNRFGTRGFLAISCHGP